MNQEYASRCNLDEPLCHWMKDQWRMKTGLQQENAETEKNEWKMCKMKTLQK